MKILKGFGFALASILFITGTAWALPSAGDLVKITGGNRLNGAQGGEFNLDIINTGNSVDFFSFCVEKSEYIVLGSTYKIQSVEDYADAGNDYLSDATKWVMWNYYKHTGLFTLKTAEFADVVQHVIWMLEDELTNGLSGDALALYNSVIEQKNKEGGYGISGGEVKVLNLVSNDYSEKHAQSQIIAAPVPEPTTMLLFGTGLIGLAGIARRRQNA